MKKRLLSMFLSLCMLLTMVPAALDWYCCAGDGRRRRDQRESDYRKHHDIDDRELCP